MLSHQQPWRVLFPSIAYARIAGSLYRATPCDCRPSLSEPELCAGFATCTVQQQQPIPAQHATSSAHHDWVPSIVHSNMLASEQTQNEDQQQDVQHDRIKPQGQHQQPHRARDPDERPWPWEGPNGVLAAWRMLSSQWWNEKQLFPYLLQSLYNLPSTTTWSVLYRPQASGLLSRLMLPVTWGTFTGLLSWKVYTKWHAEFANQLAPKVHADYDPHTFREGVQQALQYSTALYAASDWMSLRPLVSDWMLQFMQNARQQQAEAMEANNVTVSDVTLVIAPASVKIVSMSALTSKQLGQLDQQRAQDSLPLIPVGSEDEESATVDPTAAAAAAALHQAMAAPVAVGAADQIMWDVVHVYAEGVLHTSVVRDGGAAQQVELPKKGHFLLCRGPVYLDRILSEELASRTPWFLLAWL